MRNYILFLVCVILVIVWSCRTPFNGGVYCKIHGFTQGTSYNITYRVPDTIDYQDEIDSILRDFDLSLSSYIPSSIISRINSNDTGIITDEYFEIVFRKAKEVFIVSDSLFDITVMPLVNVWGFGPGNRENVDKSLIDSILQFVGMEKVRLENHRIIKADPRVQLDVNAIAQGYSVDIIADFLETQGITDYMVEIGGEVKVKGNNPKGQLWKIGIDKPEFGNYAPGEQLQAVIALNNRSLATSGNYRQFYEENGVKYTHTINPKTGYPVNQSLLSATIIADDCMTADAYATVCMVSGLEKSKKILENHGELEGYLIYGDELGWYQVYYTPGMKSMMID